MAILDSVDLLEKLIVDNIASSNRFFTFDAQGEISVGTASTIADTIGEELDIEGILNELGSLDDYITSIDFDLGNQLDELYTDKLPQLEANLDELNDEKLPLLTDELINLNENRLPQLESGLEDLNDIQLPILESKLSDLENEALPQLYDDLNVLNSQLGLLEDEQGVLDQSLTELRDSQLPILENELEGLGISLSGLDEDLTELDDRLFDATTGEFAELDDQLYTINQDLGNLDTTLSDFENDILPDLQNQLDGKLSDSLDVINETHISEGSIETPMLVSNVIVGDKLDIEEILSSTIWTEEVLANSGFINKLVSDAVLANRVTATHIGGEIVTAIQAYAQQVVANTGIIDELISEEIWAGNITSDHLGTDTVLALNIKSDEITTNELNVDQIIGNDAFFDRMVTESALIAKLVADNGFIANLTSEEIWAGNITSDHLGTDTVTALNIQVDDLVGSTAFFNQFTATDGFLDTLFINDAFADRVTVNDLAVDTVVGNQAFIEEVITSEFWTETVTANSAFLDSIVAHEIWAGLIVGGHIVAGTLTVEQMNIDNVFGDQAVVDKLFAQNAEISGRLDVGSYLSIKDDVMPSDPTDYGTNEYSGELNFQSTTSQTVSIPFTENFSTLVVDSFVGLASFYQGSENPTLNIYYQGYDGTNWVTIESRSNVGWDSPSTDKFYINTIDYSSIRLLVTSSETHGLGVDYDLNVTEEKTHVVLNQHGIYTKVDGVTRALTDFSSGGSSGGGSSDVDWDMIYNNPFSTHTPSDFADAVHNHDSRYARLSSGNTFSSRQTFSVGGSGEIIRLRNTNAPSGENAWSIIVGESDGGLILQQRDNSYNYLRWAFQIYRDRSVRVYNDLFVANDISGSNAEFSGALDVAGDATVLGNVGIGTSPDYTLDVNGTGRFSDNLHIGNRLRANSSLRRFEVFLDDNYTEPRVVMGYLEGLPKNDGGGNWTAQEYGFWVQEGDTMIIDGDIEYTDGDWLIENDAAIRILDGGTGDKVMTMGTDVDLGKRGFFMFDSNENPTFSASHEGLILGDPNKTGTYIDISQNQIEAVLSSINIKSGSTANTFILSDQTIPATPDHGGFQKGLFFGDFNEPIFDPTFGNQSGIFLGVNKDGNEQFVIGNNTQGDLLDFTVDEKLTLRVLSGDVTFGDVFSVDTVANEGNISGWNFDEVNLYNINTTSTNTMVALGSPDGTNDQLFSSGIYGFHVGQDANNRIWLGGTETNGDFDFNVRKNGVDIVRLGSRDNYISDLDVSGELRILGDGVLSGNNWLIDNDTWIHPTLGGYVYSTPNVAETEGGSITSPDLWSTRMFLPADGTNQQEFDEADKLRVPYWHREGINTLRLFCRARNVNNISGSISGSSHDSRIYFEIVGEGGYSEYITLSSSSYNDYEIDIDVSSLPPDKYTINVRLFAQVYIPSHNTSGSAETVTYLERSVQIVQLT